MFTSTTRKVATLLTALAVLAAVTGIAQAATLKPAGMSKAEYRALIIRGDAMNEKYRVGRWQNVPQGLTPAEYRALTIRGEALNKQYGLGKWSTSSSTGVSHGFSWEAFGIGAVAMLGLVLLAGGVVAGSRHNRETARVRTS